jgi:hypothetical protein
LLSIQLELLAIVYTPEVGKMEFFPSSSEKTRTQVYAI